MRLLLAVVVGALVVVHASTALAEPEAPAEDVAPESPPEPVPRPVVEVSPSTASRPREPDPVPAKPPSAPESRLSSAIFIDIVGLRLRSTNMPVVGGGAVARRESLSTMGARFFEIDFDGHQDTLLRLATGVTVARGSYAGKDYLELGGDFAFLIGKRTEGPAGAFARGGVLAEGAIVAGTGRYTVQLPRVESGLQWGLPGVFAEVSAVAGAGLLTGYSMDGHGVHTGVQPVYGLRTVVQLPHALPFPVRFQADFERVEAIGREAASAVNAGRGRLCGGHVLVMCVEGGGFEARRPLVLQPYGAGPTVHFTSDTALSIGLVIGFGIMNVTTPSTSASPSAKVARAR